MLRLLSLIIPLLLFLTGCNSSQPNEPPPDGQTLLNGAIDKIREVDAFRMRLEQVGADFSFDLGLPGVNASMVLGVANAQFKAPEEVYAEAAVTIGILTTNMQIYARDSQQWLLVPPLPWQEFTFAPDFNPADLLAEGSGFEKALTALTELESLGIETLADGTEAYHVRGSASGDIVADLLVGLVQITNKVVVDVYVDKATGFPSLVVVTVPGTATAEEAEDTGWRIEIFDFDGDINFETPPGA